MQAGSQYAVGGLDIGEGKAGNDDKIPEQCALRMIAIAGKHSQKAGEEPAEEIAGVVPDCSGACSSFMAVLLCSSSVPFARSTTSVAVLSSTHLAAREASRGMVIQTHFAWAGQ